MKHITNLDKKGKPTKKFRVVDIGDNPEVLNHTEWFEDKDSAWTNLFATAKGWNGSARVQDDTGKKRTLWDVDETGKVGVNEPDEMVPKYYPGKNKR